MAAPKAKRPWTEADWRGMTRYACALCAYDTTEHDKIVAHARDAHPDPDAYRGASDPKPGAPTARAIAHTDGNSG